MSASNTAPEVRNLKQMLQYQEKSVVSRMLVKNAAGNVTLFAFEGGEGLSEHTAPYDALIIGVEGRAEVTVGGVTHTVGEADSLLMPAHVPHAVHPAGNFKMLLVMIRGDAA
ncbi:MAG: cupin domain-containing protein [Hydrogenophaga sp.]|jgi:quercetin dioxygenase-like cupin family protein|uniref:cupin domain-containing protein n=1 Tax=Hydrogenophaga sp. TaxID=1904254 RepID=UPI000EC9D294|nr:cupin domain-containing protein [Hydrogenophaga sp.]MDD3786908.1 cupin domain-containing protein [Hydrogenophaga sp.]MDX9969491.1 cupin domain-containing protein [Hydrogenophaga sp.]HAJ12504.1 cupin domain-containing protein [Comamonadaceae bacterium]